MALTSVKDFHSCVAEPPDRPAAWSLLFLCSLIPLADTLKLGFDTLKVSAPATSCASLVTA